MTHLKLDERVQIVSRTTTHNHHSYEPPPSYEPPAKLATPTTAPTTALTTAPVDDAFFSSVLSTEVRQS